MTTKTLGKPEPDDDVVNKQPRVLLIGYGWVGQYMGKYFTEADICNAKGFIKKRFDKYDLAIIGVPTPMMNNGKCDISIVERVVKDYESIVDYFLIKSTIEIGTTDYLSNKYNVKIAMSPEYVGETLGHPLLEPRRDAFQIIGGKRQVREKIAEFFRLVLHANAPMLLCTAIEAEIIKYCENYWIMRRVDYWNDVYDICETFKVSYTTVREGIVLDPRMSRTHSNIYSDNRGWSGKCLPKDMNALLYKMKKAGLFLETLQHLILKNAQIRSSYKNKERLLPNDS